jgi:hypothetical protein
MKERFYKTEDKNDKGFEVEYSEENKKELGRGAFGAAFLVNIEAGKHKFPFVIKEYNNAVSAKDELKRYVDAKEAGFKVFPTFRIGEDGLKAIMTTGHTPEWVCIGSNNENIGGSLESLGLSKIKSIEEKSFDDLLGKYFQQASIASEKKFSLPYDAPFFLTERNATENVKMDFVLGDLGQVGKNDSDENTRLRKIKGKVMRQGVEEPVEFEVKMSDYSRVYGLQLALETFLKNNLENPKIYQDKIKNTVILKLEELSRRQS